MIRIFISAVILIFITFYVCGINEVSANAAPLVSSIDLTIYEPKNDNEIHNNIEGAPSWLDIDCVDWDIFYNYEIGLEIYTIYIDISTWRYDEYCFEASGYQPYITINSREAYIEEITYEMNGYIYGVRISYTFYVERPDPILIPVDLTVTEPQIGTILDYGYSNGGTTIYSVDIYWNPPVGSVCEENTDYTFNANIWIEDYSYFIGYFDISNYDIKVNGNAVNINNVLYKERNFVYGISVSYTFRTPSTATSPPSPTLLPTNSPSGSNDDSDNEPGGGFFDWFPSLSDFGDWLLHIIVPREGFFENEYEKINDKLKEKLPFQLYIDTIGRFKDISDIFSDDYTGEISDNSMFDFTIEKNGIKRSLDIRALIMSLKPHLKYIRSIITGIYVIFIAHYNYRQIMHLIRGTNYATMNAQTGSSDTAS